MMRATVGDVPAADGRWYVSAATGPSVAHEPVLIAEVASYAEGTEWDTTGASLLDDVDGLLLGAVAEPRVRWGLLADEFRLVVDHDAQRPALLVSIWRRLRGESPRV